MSITDVENHRSGTSAELPIDGSVRPKVMSDFRKHVGSVLAGAFGAAAFDEVAMIPVAAAVDHTGRFAENFTNRGLRSGLSAMLAYWGDSDDRAAEAEWLKHQHRDVRGHGQGEFADVRYSALNPKTWRWIAMSGLYVVLYSYTPCTGTVLRPAEEEAAYLFLRAALSSLELASEDSKLPPTLTEFRALYDSVVATELAENPFITAQFAGLTRLPLPTTLLPGWSRLLLTPAWLLVRPMIGHTIQVCSSKIMHPGVQRLTGFKLKRRHDVEYALYTRILQSAWKYLPDRVLLVPLAYNRLQYEKLVGFHRRYGHLESFTVPAGRGCPM